MKSKAIIMVISVFLIAGLLLGTVACAKPAGPTGEAKVLPLGFNITLVWPLGIDFKNAIEWDVDKINNSGGLEIGGEKYIIKLIMDDNKMDEALTKTIAQKEIFQDGCKFIMNDMWGLSIFPLVEENKIVTLATPAELTIFDPKWNWLWGAGVNHTNFCSVITYCARKFPEKKTFVGVFPDRSDGRAYGSLHGYVAEKSGLQVLEQVYYPATATDLSAIGTRIKMLNPDFLSPHGGGPQLDSAAVKAAYSAGWRGQLIGPATIPGSVTVGIAGEAAEGMISIAWPQEMEPASTAMAREYKEYYKAKFGKWDDPEIVEANMWWVLKTALQKAGSIDPAKVKAVLDNGMKYEGLNGSGQMISRPDQGNNRTVCTVLGDMPVKQLVGGQVKFIDTLTLEDELDIMKQIYGSK